MEFLQFIDIETIYTLRPSSAARDRTYGNGHHAVETRGACGGGECVEEREYVEMPHDSTE
jgi:hypothetical protein